MAELTYSTSLTLKGPWLLDSTALMELDAVIEDQWQRLKRRKAELIEERVEDGLRKKELEKPSGGDLEEKKKWYREYWEAHLGRERKEIRLHFSGGRLLETTSFADACKDPVVAGERPNGFKVELECGATHGWIDLRAGYFEELSISVFPEEGREAREVFAAFRHWALSHRAPRWQQVWARLSGFQWPIWFMIVTVGFAFANLGSERYKVEAKDRARTLLERGLSSDKVPEALEILLILESEYSPRQPPVAMPAWFKALFFGGLLGCTVLSIRPKVVIGIGKGASRILARRLWLRFVGVTLPTLFFGRVVWPKLEPMIWQILR